MSSGGSRSAPLHVHQKQIVDRVFVFLAIQPVQHLAVGDVLRRGKLVERIFEPRDQRVDRFAVRLFRARRRHHAAAQLAHRLLEKFRILSHARGRDALEADAADLGFVVVAARAVLLDGGQIARRANPAPGSRTKRAKTAKR